MIAFMFFFSLRALGTIMLLEIISQGFVQNLHKQKATTLFLPFHLSCEHCNKIITNIKKSFITM